MGDAESADVIRFASPELLAFAAIAVLWVLLRVRSLPIEHSGARRYAIQGLIVLGTLAAGLALSGIELGARHDRMAVVFAVDRSRSVERSSDPNATKLLEQINEAADAMGSNDRAGLVVFGAQAATEVMPGPRPAFGTVRASIGRDATDMAAGLRQALADVPAEHGARIVLISDGLETRGDALGAASGAMGRGIPIDVFAIEAQARAEVGVERVRLPAVANPGEPVELSIVTHATTASDVRVRVTRDGTTIAEAETRIAVGNDVLVMRDVAPEPGIHRYDVLLEASDERSDSARENNEGGGVIRVLGESRALVLASEPTHAQALVDAIEETGIHVDLRQPALAPGDLAGWASYDLVVLSDVHSRSFADSQLEDLRSYVRDLGGGLLMVGTRDSFGLGGYAYTPVEEALPATFDLRNRRDRASLAMVIAIDNSGSMSVEVGPGTTKLDLANEAAARSAMLLSPFDRVGVAHVDTEVHWTLPVAGVDDPRRVAAAIRRGQPGGGGIFVDEAMRAAYGSLQKQPTQLKHFLLFSDGSDSENMGGTRGTVAAALRDRITTSIVSMGNGPDTPELERLSRLGGGRFYIVENMRELPRIFTEETIEASRSAIVDTPFQATAAAPSAVMRGIDVGTAPPLGGYVVMNQKPRTTRLLHAREGDPLLLVGHHGVGKSATFAADAGSNFTRAWLGWSGYRALFGQLARDIQRPASRADAQVDVRIENGRGRVRVEAIDERGRYRNHLDLHATIAAPGGQPLDLQLQQTGAGRYEASFDGDAPGAYFATVREGASTMVGTAGAVRPAGDELRGAPTDHAKLAQIAALTGGAVRRDLRGIFSDRPAPTYSYSPLWPILLVVSLCALLLSVAMRRLVLPAGWWIRFVPKALLTRRRDGRAATEPLVTLEALSRAREQASSRRPAAPEVEHAIHAVAARQESPQLGKATPDPEPPAAPPPPPPSEEKSLAETLLARRRKK